MHHQESFFCYYVDISMKTGDYMNDRIVADNQKIFALLSHYLNHAPDYVEREEIEELVKCRVSYEQAFSMILAAAFGLDMADEQADKEFFIEYFPKIFFKLDTAEYAANPYYQNIQMPAVTMGKSELKYEKYKAFEGFVCNDIVRTLDGRQYPQIGFFAQEFTYPAILENGRIWMTVTPNEVETMKEAVKGARGKVLAYGLGLGYYAYMVSEKEEVNSITVVEKNSDIIQLFQTHIFPQFKHAEKVQIIEADAFEYAKQVMPAMGYDFVFTDLWHDVSDGIGMYKEMKHYEKLCPRTKFAYWIEKSILCYL